MLRAKIELIPIPDGWMKVYSLNKSLGKASVSYEGIIDAERGVADVVFTKRELDLNNIRVFKDKLGIRSRQRAGDVYSGYRDVFSMHWFTVKNGGEVIFRMVNADTTRERDFLIFKNIDGELFFTISSNPTVCDM